MNVRQLSMTTRNDLVWAVSERYASSSRAEKTAILNEFTAVTGFHRKHAVRLLRGVGDPRSRRRPRPMVYGEAAREAMLMLWEASDRVCGKRLRAMVPLLVEAMERHGHLSLAPEIRERVMGMSAATIDRVLRPARDGAGRGRRRRATPAVRSGIPVRTSQDWGAPPPGFMEADLVLHCGSNIRGSYVQTLVLTDIATGWTECAPLLVREQRLLTEVLDEVRRVLPFQLLGLDTDNDSVFMNETLKDWCASGGIHFTRCRPYRKNDQAWVEQKNGAVVRRSVGYRRLEGLDAAAALGRLYADLRLFTNIFQPSFKVVSRDRDGARVRKRHLPPATPCRRLLDDPRTPPDVAERLQAMISKLDPVRLLRDIRAGQATLVALADADPAQPRYQDQPVDDLARFLSGLRTAWQRGEVRPTSAAKPKVKRGRRRPDPLVSVTEQLRVWFLAEPWKTSRELLDRLQVEHPGDYPDGRLRTLQRRVKGWRMEHARALIVNRHSIGTPDRRAKRTPVGARGGDARSRQA
jgi:hypothetical protein